MDSLIFDEFLFRIYNDVCILYNIKTLSYFVFEDIFSDFFRLSYANKMSPNEIIDHITEEYDVDRTQVCLDFEEFVAEINKMTAGANAIISVPDSNGQYSEDYIFEIVSERLIPFTATIEITNACNLKCVHCYRDDSSYSCWDISSFQEIISELKELGALHIVLTGSEPLMHENIREFIKIIVEQGFVLTIQTNATLLTSDNIDILSKAIIRKIYVSLYSSSSSVHDSITKVEGSFYQTLTNVKRLLAKNIPVAINCPVMQQNKNTVSETYELCNALGLECNFSFKIIPAQSSGKETENLNCFSEDFMLSLIANEYIKLYNKEIEKIINLRRKVPDEYCQSGFRSITIGFDREIYLCNVYRKKCGNLKSKNLKEIWFDSTNLNLWRHKISNVNDKCKKCKAYDFCEPCPANTYTQYGIDDDIDKITCSFGKTFYTTAKKYIDSLNIGGGEKHEEKLQKDFN